MLMKMVVVVGLSIVGLVTLYNLRRKYKDKLMKKNNKIPQNVCL